jgi:hypothetical protein
MAMQKVKYTKQMTVICREKKDKGHPEKKKIAKVV